MGQINVEGVGAVQIQGDTPTPEEAQRIISAVMGLGKRQPDKTVVEDVSGGPFIVRTPARQLKIPLREKGIGGPGFDPGRAIAKGLRDLVTGVITFPLDVAGEDVLADRIRRNIPEIETGGAAEDVTAAITQFGIPGGAAAKLVKLTGVGQKAGIAGALLRFGANVTAATGADIIAANPDDVQTLGNLFPELLPTGIDPGDPALLKRLKLGVEAGTITATALSALGGTLFAWKGITKVLRQFFKTDQAAQEAAAKVMREIAQDPEKAVENINRIIQETQGTPFRPTTGTASGDPGLIALERSLATTGETSPAFMARLAENQSAISQQVTRVTRRVPGAAERPRTFFEEDQLQARMVKTQAVEATEDQVLAARNEIDNIADELNEFRSMETGASIEIDAAVMGELERLTLQKNKLFRAIDPERSVLVDPADLRETVEAITTKRGPLDSTPGKLPPVVARLKKATAAPKKGKDGKIKKPKPLFFGDLEDARPDLSAAIKKARADNEGGVVERLIELRQALDGEAAKLADAGGPAAERAAEAIDFFRDIFAPRFRQGVGRAVSTAAKRGAPIEPSALAGRFVRTGPSALEAGEDLARIVGGIADPSQAREAVRQFVLSRLAKAAIDPSGKFNPQRIAKFLETHDDALAGFPGIRSEIKALSGRAIKAERKLTQFEGDLVDAREAAKLTEREQNRSVTALFLGTDPEKAVARVMGSDDPGAAMSRLVKEAAKDRSGQAKKGLRVAVDRWLDNKVRSRSVNLAGDDFIIVANEVEDLFKNPRTKKALEAIYSQPEMKVLERARDQLRLMARLNTQVTTGSPTAAIQQNVQRVRIVLASMYGIVRGRGIFAISGWVLKALGKDPVVNARAVLRDAMLDPSLAKLMLAADGPSTRRILEQRLRTYVANNIASELVTEDKPRRRGRGTQPRRSRFLRSGPAIEDVTKMPLDEVIQRVRSGGINPP